MTIRMHPRFWLTWMGLGLMRLSVLLPYTVQMRLGKGLGLISYYLARRRRCIAQTNIEACFPQLTPIRQRQLVRETFLSAGMSLFEIGLAWWGRESVLKPLVHIEGVEHLRAAQAAGKGVVLLSAHMTCLEIGGRLLSMHQPFAVMYRRHRNAVFEQVMKRFRQQRFVAAIERKDVRAMVRLVRQNHICWYAPDQDFGRRRSVFAPFMGVSTATIPATSRLSRLSGAPVVPFFPARRADGKGYDLTILPAIESFPSGDDAADAATVNATIEQFVRQHPDQYLWMHRRFKTRPEGETPFYRC